MTVSRSQSLRLLRLALCVALPLTYLSQMVPHAHHVVLEDDAAHAAATGHAHRTDGPLHPVDHDPGGDDCASDHEHSLCQHVELHIVGWVPRDDDTPDGATAIYTPVSAPGRSRTDRTRIIHAGTPLRSDPALDGFSSRAPPRIA